MTDALFWQHSQKSDDPFLEPPLPPAFYHPSLARPLTKGESQIKLSPQKRAQSDHTDRKEDAEAANQLSPQEKAFMGRANTILTKEMPTRDTPSPPDTSSKFNESWPTSERPSTLIESPAESSARENRDGAPSQNVSVLSKGSSGGEECFDFASFLLKQKGGVSQSQEQRRTDDVMSGPKHDSVLARYIHRFRNAAPQSRKERAKQGVSKDLWWMSPPTRDTSSSSSTVARPPYKPRDQPPIGLTTRRDASGSSSSLSDRVSSSNIHVRHKGQGRVPPPPAKSRTAMLSDDVSDPETFLLQEKAQHLLEISESSILSEPLVSSEGVGTSSPSLPSSDGKIHVPSEISPIRDTCQKQYHSQQQAPPPSRAARSQRPEDDILYQWRLRRKMELARKHGEHPNQPTESSLEAFRSRLHQPSSKPVQHEGIRGPSPFCKTTGTDPIPQAASTQTCQEMRNTLVERDSMLQGGPSTDFRTASHSGFDKGTGRLDQRYINNLSKLSNMREARHFGDESHGVVEESGGQSKPIAMPVRGVRGRTACNVPPHWHLSCDIIPCPHDNVLHHHDQDEVGKSTDYCDTHGSRQERLQRGMTDNVHKKRGEHSESSLQVHQERPRETGSQKDKDGIQNWAQDDRHGDTVDNSNFGQIRPNDWGITQDPRTFANKVDAQQDSKSDGHWETTIGTGQPLRKGQNLNLRTGEEFIPRSQLSQVFSDSKSDARKERAVESELNQEGRGGRTVPQRDKDFDTMPRTDSDYGGVGTGVEERYRSGLVIGRSDQELGRRWRNGQEIVPTEDDFSRELLKGTGEHGQVENCPSGLTDGRHTDGEAIPCHKEKQNRVRGKAHVLRSSILSPPSAMDTRDTDGRAVSPTWSSDTEPFTDISSEVEAGTITKPPLMEPQDILQSTVSQVVKRTVFGSDLPKPSLSSSGKSTDTPQTSSGAEAGSHSPETNESSPPSTSDGEEFPEDDLLQMLRKKRALYENQLKQIDDLILEKQMRL